MEEEYPLKKILIQRVDMGAFDTKASLAQSPAVAAHVCESGLTAKSRPEIITRLMRLSICNPAALRGTGEAR